MVIVHAAPATVSEQPATIRMSKFRELPRTRCLTEVRARIREEVSAVNRRQNGEEEFISVSNGHVSFCVYWILFDGDNRFDEGTCDVFRIIG